MKWKWPQLIQTWKGALGKYQFVLLVLAAGLLLLLLPTGGERDSPAPQQESETAFDLEGFEEKLAHALSQVEGAGKAQVVLTLSSGSRQVLAQDQELAGDGSSASTVVTVGRGSGTQEVVPLQTVAPSFRGALVICPGGGNPQVRLELIEAVSALTGLSSNHITVCQGNQ